jgi:uncharacterized membrane protein YjfL (UPF0719 family)
MDMQDLSFAAFFEQFISTIGKGLPLFMGTLVLLWIARFIRERTSTYNENKQLFVKDNHAVGIAVAGYYIGILIALTGVLAGPSLGLKIDMRDCAVYGILAILFQNIAGWSADKFILKEFNIDDELIRDKNKGTAWSLFGIYFATGMVVRGSIMGGTSEIVPGLVSALVYFILSQLVLILSSYFYRLITAYDFHKEIEDDNVAAGLAFGGFVAAVGVIIGHASGDSLTLPDIAMFFSWTVVGLLLLWGTEKIVVKYILVPGHNVSEEIQVDRNENASWMLVVGYQAVAWVFVLAV